MRGTGGIVYAFSFSDTVGDKLDVPAVLHPRQVLLYALPRSLGWVAQLVWRLWEITVIVRSCSP
jgi:hypothetical protein